MVDEKIVASHESRVFHVQGEPLSIIVDDEIFDKVDFTPNELPSCDYKIKCDQVFAGATPRDVGPVGIIIELTLKFKDNQRFTFKIIPDEEFVTTLIETKILYFVTSRYRNYFQIKINTKTIENVWMPNDT